MERLKFNRNANQSVGWAGLWEAEVCRKLLAEIGVRAIETDPRPKKQPYRLNLCKRRKQSNEP